jgi:hypothetical protein
MKRITVKKVPVFGEEWIEIGWDDIEKMTGNEVVEAWIQALKDFESEGIEGELFDNLTDPIDSTVNGSTAKFHPYFRSSDDS